MRMMLKLAALLPLLAAAPANAALSGFYDSAEQIGVILSSGKVADAVRQAPVEALTHSGTRKDGAREWTVRVHNCSLKVYLVAVPPKGLGKTTYQLEIPGQCR